jgi:TolB-like protein
MSSKTSFFEELMRRNVVRVGVVYLITAWLLAQVADLMLENFHAPEWVIQAILVVLIIGFPLAVIFAWAFEMTPEGIKKEKDVDRAQSITQVTKRKLDFTIIGILALAVVFLLADRFVSVPETPVVPEAASGEETEARAEQAKSVAVLPFVNMSSDPEQEYFSDGISEEILNALAKVKELKVAGRTSSFAFKGKNQDLRQIGDTLGVEHILEGSVRKSGATVRITAQLIQVDDGFHLWSETYDRELTDVFAIQDEIASAILEQLKAQLIGTDAEPMVAAARTDSEVYDLYLLARQRLYERKRLSIESAIELLDKAISKDPGYAPAYAQRGIAALLMSERNYGDASRADAQARSRLYLDKALQLDPNLAEAWAGMGLYHTDRPGEHLQAIEALEKSLSINPNLIDASNWLQVVVGETGDNVRALEIVESMVDRDPLYPPGFGNAINMYNLFGYQDRSWALLERIRPFMPNDPQVLQAEANTWLSLGEQAKAIPLIESALEQQPSDGVLRNILMFGLLQTGQYEKIVEIGPRWARSIGLVSLDRVEEATQIASELASEGRIGPLFGLLSRTNQHDRLVELIESRWVDLDAFESEYPDDGSGYSLMLQIALAYSKLGNVTHFEDAMNRVRTAHERAREQGIRDNFFFVHEARYYALAGNRDQAIARLTQAVDEGMSIGTPLDRVWQELDVLRTDPRFEAVEARMFEHLNAERAALGLEPISA